MLNYYKGLNNKKPLSIGSGFLFYVEIDLLLVTHLGIHLFAAFI